MGAACVGRIEDSSSTLNHRLSANSIENNPSNRPTPLPKSPHTGASNNPVLHLHSQHIHVHVHTNKTNNDKSQLKQTTHSKLIDTSISSPVHKSKQILPPLPSQTLPNSHSLPTLTPSPPLSSSTSSPTRLTTLPVIVAPPPLPNHPPTPRRKGSVSRNNSISKKSLTPISGPIINGIPPPLIPISDDNNNFVQTTHARRNSIEPGWSMSSADCADVIMQNSNDNSIPPIATGRTPAVNSSSPSSKRLKIDNQNPSAKFSEFRKPSIKHNTDFNTQIPPPLPSLPPSIHSNSSSPSSRNIRTITSQINVEDKECNGSNSDRLLHLPPLHNIHSQPQIPHISMQSDIVDASEDMRDDVGVSPLNMKLKRLSFTSEDSQESERITTIQSESSILLLPLSPRKNPVLLSVSNQFNETDQGSISIEVHTSTLAPTSSSRRSLISISTDESSAIKTFDNDTNMLTNSIPTLRLTSSPRSLLQNTTLTTAPYHPTGTGSHSKAAKLDYYLHDCTQITPYLYVGGQIVASNKALLQSHGITHIINACGNICDNYFEGVFTYCKLFLQDRASEDIVCMIYDVCEFIDTARLSGKKVLIHCQQGVSRSTILAIAYLMFADNSDYEDMYSVVRSKRGVCRPNFGFMCQLMNWRKRMKGLQSNLVHLYRFAYHNNYDHRIVNKRIDEKKKKQLDARFNFLIQTPAAIFIFTGEEVTKEKYSVYSAEIKKTIQYLQKYEHASFRVYHIIRLKQGEAIEGSTQEMMEREENIIEVSAEYSVNLSEQLIIEEKRAEQRIEYAEDQVEEDEASANNDDSSQKDEAGDSDSDDDNLSNKPTLEWNESDSLPYFWSCLSGKKLEYGYVNHSYDDDDIIDKEKDSMQTASISTTSPSTQIFLTKTSTGLPKTSKSSKSTSRNSSNRTSLSTGTAEGACTEVLLNQVKRPSQIHTPTQSLSLSIPITPPLSGGSPPKSVNVLRLRVSVEEESCTPGGIVTGTSSGGLVKVVRKMSVDSAQRIM